MDGMPAPNVTQVTKIAASKRRKSRTAKFCNLLSAALDGGDQHERIL